MNSASTPGSRFGSRTKLAAVAVVALLALSSLSCLSPATAQTPTRLDQGSAWTPDTWTAFYSGDQGSRMIPFSWLKALKLPDGSGFLDDGLARYGYLPNPDSPDGLPVGFNAADFEDVTYVGMTCAACHTRQITVGDTSYRVDGGPAIVVFQDLMADVDTAMGAVMADETVFFAFAEAVLGPNPTRTAVRKLRGEAETWYRRWHTIVERGLPHDDPWGPSRLDAVGMIFNRLTGLDLGPRSNDYIIADNIRTADAPTRYPFLWNAAIQDKTQWPGFADNGSNLLGLARNLGEVYGVFGIFHPRNKWLYVDFLDVNSANFDGLWQLEELIQKIGPPQWAWSVDEDLAKTGEAIFNRSAADGGCVSCHGIEPGTPRLTNPDTWRTPIQDVGTDTREYDILAWTAKTGVLEGSWSIGGELGAEDSSFAILSLAVVRSILQKAITTGLGDLVSAVESGLPAGERDRLAALEDKAKDLLSDDRFAQLAGAFQTDLKDLLTGAQAQPKQTEAVDTTQSGAYRNCGKTEPYCYESRVMEGIWAAAPYLHNGSVPTLWDLLQPAAERPAAFAIGPAYDLDKVGLAAEQTRFDFTLQTTDCSDRNSGRSRCGHEFGTWLTEAEKKALLEYLKTL